MESARRLWRTWQPDCNLMLRDILARNMRRLRVARGLKGTAGIVVTIEARRTSMATVSSCLRSITLPNCSRSLTSAANHRAGLLVTSREPVLLRHCPAILRHLGKDKIFRTCLADRSHSGRRILWIPDEQIIAGIFNAARSTCLGSRYIRNTAELDVFQTAVAPLDAPDVNGLDDVPRSVDLDRTTRAVALAAP
jgi:hypothetical protein